MAMRGMKFRVVRKHRSLNNLSLSNVACPVCMCILIEPVTLPCNHDLCLECFEKFVEVCGLTCPMCRKRIGSWLRQTKHKSLVNQTLWEFIQEKFPHEVQAKLKGDDDAVADRLTAMIPPVSLAVEGEIGEEFALEVERFKEENRKKQKLEENASLALIRKLERSLRRSKRIQQRKHSEAKQKSMHIARRKKVTVRGVPVEASTTTSVEPEENHNVLPNRSNQKATQGSTVSLNEKIQPQKPRRKSISKNKPAAPSSKTTTHVVKLSDKVIAQPCSMYHLSGELPAVNTIRLLERNSNSHTHHAIMPNCETVLNQLSDTNNITNATEGHTSALRHPCVIARQLFPPKQKAYNTQPDISVPNPSIHSKGSIRYVHSNHAGEPSCSNPTTFHSQTQSNPVQQLPHCCKCQKVDQLNQHLPNRGPADLTNLLLTQHIQKTNIVHHIVHYINPHIYNSLTGSEEHQYFKNQQSGNNIYSSGQRQGISAQDTATSQVFNYNKHASQSTQQQLSNSRGQPQEHTIFLPFYGITPIEIEIK